ncbi:Uncharacterised protein [Pannonibacter phragmitetus]|uniref:Uncharacterized protein n=1 Tax=Pannonibacter phragmitetus TaxID=121719 RepID=A0A378ZTH0_9HYPH|nr:hypothetical protein [Pannonibacter phragmitetus]SUA99861.1 Uncharacterised protein [Pannonibacter phragmitetus]
MEGQLASEREPDVRLPRAGSPALPASGTGNTPQAAVNRDLVRLALHKITGSPEFSASLQLRQFLTFVVEASIADPPVPLKGYTIATQALGRDDSFNPATDPIVRVEAARLRKRLEDYYAGTGHGDPVRIIIPRGSYQPGFHLMPAPEASGAPQAGPETSPEPPLPDDPALTPPASSRGVMETAQIRSFPVILLRPAVFFPLMALAFAAGYAAAHL